jgi:flagellar hook-associated protein FlgK
MTLQELKAQAYDAIAQINNWQAKLNELNQQIANFKEDEKPKEK